MHYLATKLKNNNYYNYQIILKTAATRLTSHDYQILYVTIIIRLISRYYTILYVANQQ
jgi:hypothetical protein